MNVRELLEGRYGGVVIDRDSHTLIQVSRPTQQARMTKSVIGVALGVLSGLIAGLMFDGAAALLAVLIACAVIYVLLYRAPAARICYTSWMYPESYNLFEDELIRDRFATHRDEFTLVED